MELQNLKDAVSNLATQVAATKAAILALQSSVGGIAPADVQAQADAVNQITSDLKASTPGV